MEKFGKAFDVPKFNWTHEAGTGNQPIKREVKHLKFSCDLSIFSYCET